MNSSNDAAISAQTNQPRTATFQHSSTRSYQNQTWAPLAQLQGPSRPLSYSEIVKRTEHHWESLPVENVSSKPLKGWLRLAESIRRDAKNFDKQEDLESAFVEYAKVATIVLKNIPTHPDYRVLLSTKHRHNMGQHEQEILDRLAQIKKNIINKQSLWKTSSSVKSQTSYSSFTLISPPRLYRQPLSEDDSARREAVIHTNGTRQVPGKLCVYMTLYKARDPTGHRREWEEEVQRWVAGQRRLEQDGIIRQQREADHAARTSQQGETGPVMPVSSESASATTASASGPITAYGPCNKPDKPPIQPVTAVPSLSTRLAAFHPHPDRPIYTDSDKGHVHISGLPLETVDLRGHTASESRDGLIALPSRRGAVAVPSEDTLEVVDGSLSRYRHSKASHNVEGEEEEVVHAPRTAGGHDDGPISEPEIPKQRPTVLHPTKTPAQRRNVSHKSTIPSVDHSDGLALSTGNSMQSGAAAHPTPEVFESFDMLHRAPESQLHDQPEYLHILKDKFGTPRPDRDHRCSFTDKNSSRNEVDGDYQENFVDPDNESYNGRCSVKTVSKGSLFNPSILSPARSQMTSIFN